MPSFYPRNMPRQLPLTPPDFVPSYNTNGCGNMQPQQPQYPTQQGQRQDEGYDFADRYGQLSIAVPPMYPQSGTYLSSAPPALPPSNSYYEPMGAPILPPMRVHNGPRMGEAAMHQRRAQDQPQRNQPPKEDKSVGGVSAKLDYDMEVMTDFVTAMAHGIISPAKELPPSYRRWVGQVLCATRLPSATILLSLHYLSSRLSMLSTGGGPSEVDMYRTVTVALIMGSKFLDDNTFINRSWAEVSGIAVAILNEMETEWLIAIDFKLHRDPAEQQGWCSWNEHWKEYQRVQLHRPNTLSPIDTTVQRQRVLNQNKPLPPTPLHQSFGQCPAYEFGPKPQSQYSTPAYSQYDPWLVPRSATDNSPASAPTTGPTTPEYYGGPGTWAPPEGYSRRTMFGFSSLSQPPHQSQPHQQPANYGPPAYTPQYNTPVWSNHPVNCSCMYCAQRQPSYFMAPGYGPQSVAG
ncbi:uncharacterized protein BDZ99DRAFT_164318 [Mytilinidion resinicola]|uniref:Cyclin-like protein n=1 Tax=Mytilinidion resinicola TaxID=574789 RepID=A0A6A6Y4W9_9PEZI|nr:uncharacterized protein BDZ99DRAFT_164318 [Mytilinidion resinicola]KAF2803856.1 hypothetical protein BDZ99DRAFT_164318 [Mytilinidion resinicola]